MKIKINTLLLFLCSTLLLTGCNQAAAPTAETPGTHNEVTTSASTPTTTTPTTTQILLNSWDKTTTTASKADPTREYTTLEDMKTTYYHIDRDVYRGPFATNFYELYEYGEDPEGFREEMKKLEAERSEGREYVCGDSTNVLTIMDFITVGNLKKEDVIHYFEKRMLKWIEEGKVTTDEEKEAHTYFTYEEIDVLFSGDDRLIKETFKTPWAVLADDGELYSVLWLTEHSIKEWQEVGITKENIKAPAEYWNYLYHDQYLEEIGLRDKLEELYAA